MTLPLKEIVTVLIVLRAMETKTVSFDYSIKLFKSAIRLDSIKAAKLACEALADRRDNDDIIKKLDCIVRSLSPIIAKELVG